MVRKISAATGHEVRSLIGNQSLLKTLNAADYTDARFGLPTVTVATTSP